MVSLIHTSLGSLYHIAHVLHYVCVCGTCREGRGVGEVGIVGMLRVMCCHLRAGFQQCKSFVEMGTVRCCPLFGVEDCITSTRRLWRAALVSRPRRRPTRRRASPAPLSAQTVAGCRLG